MTRVLSSACVVLLVLGMTGRAWGGGKPSIAILGLEVYDNGSGIDPETTRAAKELTTALRDRAKAGTGPYAPVQGGDKELIDEKLLNNCDTEANSCMAAIGAELNAEVLLFGKIEKATQNNQPIYRITLKLLHVGHKQVLGSTVETLPVDAASGIKASAHAKAWYAKLAPAATGGTLVVKANIDRGTVLLDDDARGNLASGTLTLPNVPEGRHVLAVEGTKEYQRYETQITIRTGETTIQPVTMVEMPKKTASVGPTTGPVIEREGTVTSRKGNLWKPVFYTSAAVTVAAAGFSVYALVTSSQEGEKVKTPKGMGVDQGKCGQPNLFQDPDTSLNAANQTHFDAACKWHNRQIIGWVVTGVAGAAAIGSFLMAYVRNSGPESETRTARTGRKRRELAITPVIMPQGGGATLQFDW